ncbi:MAG: hypothetical protein OEV44_11570 [Spirochaetota bacterium]|nr:hypothetical protein [Spirochaetota bacterium]
MSNEIRTLGQKMFDNIWFLLAVGILVPGIFYFAWGMLEIYSVPPLSDYLKQIGLSDLLTGGK